MPEFIGKFQKIRLLDLRADIMLAVVDMIPPEQSNIKPSLNTIQTLIITIKQGDIAIFQNTPAAFHAGQNSATYSRIA